MIPLGKCLVFHFKYWNEMSQLYWKDGALEGLDEKELEKTRQMVLAVGNESCAEAARLLESCGEVIEEHFKKVAKCARQSRASTAEKNWSISFNIWMAVRPGSPRFQAGVDIPQHEKAEIIPWLWCHGKGLAEEKMVDYLKDRVKARSDDLLFPAGAIALDRIPLLDGAQGFDVDTTPLLAKVRQAFSSISRPDCEILYRVPKMV